MTFVSNLDPKGLWKHFDEILRIPRGSKNEEAVRQYVLGVAKKAGLDCEQDSAGNVVVRKPATPGCEGAVTTVLQSHLDMVNEKNSDVTHDFMRDPIVPRLDGDYLKATGTSLGADNGIGVAASLAVLEDSQLQHGPLECLFTIDEETGLTGASSLSGDLLTAKAMINLDTEEEGAIYIGCAGGAGQNITFHVVKASVPSGCGAFKVNVKGLKGGHSGVDIHLQRGNAIRLLARLLQGALSKQTFYLSDLSGGNMRNAIARESTATVVAPVESLPALRTHLESAFSQIADEFRVPEPDAALAIVETETPKRVIACQSTEKLVQLLHALPHGVMAMSNDIPGLVETSSNLATVKTESDQVAIHVSSRSSVASALEATMMRVDAVCKLAGAKVEWVEGYPGWKPDTSSPLLAMAREIHKEVVGTDPEIKAIHAGLECGIIKEKYPSLDIISIGPRIEFPHSPDERVKIDTVAEFYTFLSHLLARTGRG